MGALEGETVEGLGVHRLLFEAKKDAVGSQLAELEGELVEYEGLKSGGIEFGAGEEGGGGFGG